MLMVWQFIAGGNTMEKKNKTAYIAPDVLLTYLIGNDAKTKELLELKTDMLVTSAFSFHEALSALDIEEIKENAQWIKFLLDNIPILDTKPVTGKATVQSEERTKHLRSLVR